jgi:hypothetical protein
MDQGISEDKKQDESFYLLVCADFGTALEQSNLGGLAAAAAVCEPEEECRGDGAFLDGFVGRWSH